MVLPTVFRSLRRPSGCELSPSHLFSTQTFSSLGWGFVFWKCLDFLSAVCLNVGLMGHLEQKMWQYHSLCSMCSFPPSHPPYLFLTHISIHVHLTLPSASSPPQHFMSRLNILFYFILFCFIYGPSFAKDTSGNIFPQKLTALGHQGWLIQSAP